jgi:lysophospholipase L1-like esterase
MSYESIVSRRLNADHINLGFAGYARGEDEIAEYISNLEMSCFVYDYDHNANTVEDLKNTHEKMFKRIRSKNPDVPIIMMPRPKFCLTEGDVLRLNVIKETYNNAIENGDKNVYLIEGEKLMQMAGNDGTVDNTHPTDLGFASMAKAVGDLLEKILK